MPRSSAKKIKHNSLGFRPKTPPTLEGLPNELLARIFSLLGERKDVGACRLVSRILKEISSPHLITSVTYANRPREIVRLKEVIEHPYFCKYVTDLVYDASYFHRAFASDYDEYIEACDREPRTFRNPEWSQWRDEEVALWHSISTMDSNSSSDGEVNTDNSSVSSGGGDADAYGASLEETDDEISDNTVSSNASASTYERIHRRAYRRGYHAGFYDYHSLYVSQRKIERQALAQRVLKRAFTELPGLKHVVLTDWRYLASPVQTYNTYNECAHRLFKNTLAPNFASCTTIKRACEQLADSIDRAKCMKSIISFVLPSDSCPTEERCRRGGDPDKPLTMTVGALDPMVELLPRLENLRRLRLPIDLNHLPSSRRRKAREAVRLSKPLASAPSLTSLTLYVDLVERPDNMSTIERVAWRTIPFRLWLKEQHLPKLETLELCGFTFPDHGFQHFLSAHVATMRKLHLINCSLEGDVARFSSWAGKNMHLEGVEIYSKPFRNMEDLFYESDPEIGKNFGKLRRNVVEPFESELELLWLAGRSNTIGRTFIARTTDPEDSDHSSDSE